jgi:hypothetical protein
LITATFEGLEVVKFLDAIKRNVIATTILHDIPLSLCYRGESEEKRQCEELGESFRQCAEMNHVVDFLAE